MSWTEIWLGVQAKSKNAQANSRNNQERSNRHLSDFRAHIQAKSKNPSQNLEVTGNEIIGFNPLPSCVSWEISCAELLSCLAAFFAVCGDLRRFGPMLEINVNVSSVESGGDLRRMCRETPKSAKMENN